MTTAVDTFRRILDLGINPDFFQFMGESMVCAQRKLKTARHVTGQELCLAFRDLAIQTFGGMALCVVHHWKIHSTMDIGRAVYKLIDAKIYSREAEDSIDHFNDVFNFEEAFSLEKYVSSICLN